MIEEKNIQKEIIDKIKKIQDIRNVPQLIFFDLISNEATGKLRSEIIKFKNIPGKNKIEEILINYREVNAGIPNHGHRKYHPFTQVKMTNRLHKTFQVRTQHRNPAALRKDDIGSHY